MNKQDISTTLAGEIASRQSVNFGFGGMMMSLPNPDPISKRLGRDIEVYREIMNDPAIKGATRRRRSAVVGLEYGLEQGDASDKVMALCKTVLSRIKLRSLIRELHDASWYGYSPAEVYWEKDGGLWLPSKAVGKPPEWFGFDDNNRLCLKQNGKFTPVPPMKFITARNDPTFVNPYGVADLAAVYWLSVFRKGGLKFWLRFVDKYGQAFVVGKHPRATPHTEVEKILDSLEMLSQDGVAVIPNDGSVEILESVGKGATADMFERLLKYCRDEINIALLGQNQSTDASSTNASAQSGIEVTKDIRDADGVMIAEAINQLLGYVVALNVGDNEPVPVWSMWEETDVTAQLATRDMNMQQAGARLTKHYFMRAYDLAEDEMEVDAPLSANARRRGRELRSRSNVVNQMSGGEATFSEQVGGFFPVRRDFANDTAEQLANDAQPVMNAWLLRLKYVVDNAPSLEDLPHLIAREFDELPTDKLVEVIQLAMMAGTLAGMGEVVAENE